MNIRVIRHETVAEFERHYRQWLMEKEDLNNSLLSLMSVLMSEEHLYSPPYWYGGVIADDSIIGCGIHAHPDGLVITEIPDVALPKMIESVGPFAKSLCRAYGPVKTVETFANLWCEKFSVNQRIQSCWHVYRANQINPPRVDVPGYLRLGNSSDSELVNEWGSAYGKEKPAPLDVADFMRRKLGTGDLYIWEDRAPMTMITLSGRTDHGIRISAVYTPSENRGQGYASAAVSSIGQRMLDDGLQWITLSAEVDDPAERLYQRIGFEIIENKVSIAFRDQ